MVTTSVDPRVERARLLYVETEVPLDEVSRRIGVPKTTLRTWITRHGWPRRPPRPFGRPKLTPDAHAETGGGAQPPAKAKGGSARPPKLEPAPAGRAQTTPKPTPKRKRPTTKTLVDRLYSIINHHIEVMESRMSDDDHTTTSDNPERDARAIGNLVRSVEKLKELEPDQSKRDAGSVRHSRYPLSPGEEEKLRDEIVDRLLRLRERLRGPRAD